MKVCLMPNESFLKHPTHYNNFPNLVATISSSTSGNLVLFVIPKLFCRL